MGSIDKALPHAGFYPDSQNRCSDGAKIRSIFESSKYFGTFFIARRFFLAKFFFIYIFICVYESQETDFDASDFSGDSNLSSQIVISRLIDKNGKSWGGLRKPPYAFTENGVAMLSSVLRSPLAIQVNIGIMRAFTEFRRMASTLALPNTAKDIAQLRKDFEDLKLDIEDILHDQNDINESTRMQLENITLALSELQAKEPKHKPRRRIGFIQNDD